MAKKKSEPIQTGVDGLTERLRLRAARRMDQFLGYIADLIDNRIGKDGGKVECREVYDSGGKKMTISDLLNSFVWELEPVLLPVFEENTIAEFMERAGNLSSELDEEEAEAKQQ